jgi:hypothetical protein
VWRVCFMEEKGVRGSMWRRTVVRWDFRRRVQVVGVGVVIFVCGGGGSWDLSLWWRWEGLV